jgi:hypothetical protein
MKTRLLFLSLFCLCSAFVARSQDTLWVTGIVLDDTLGVPLSKSTVLLRKEGESLEKLKIDDSGQYAFFFLAGSKYTAAFSAKGHLAKLVEFDLTKLPQNNDKKSAYQLDIEIALQNKPKGFNEELLLVPFARCSYSSETDLVSFDTAYINERKTLIDAEIQRCLVSE